MSAVMKMDVFGDRSAKGNRSLTLTALEHLEAGIRQRIDAFLEDHRRLRQHAGSPRRILGAGVRLATATDLAAVCDLAVETLLELFRLRGVAISVVETYDGDRLSFSRHRGVQSVEPDDLIFEADSSLVAALQSEKKPLNVSDLVGRTGPRSKERSVLRRLECELVVPLVGEDRVLGLLLLTRHTHGAPFPDDDIQLIAAYGSFLSLTVENILLRSASQWP